MSQVEILEVHELPGDVLRVRGTVEGVVQVETVPLLTRRGKPRMKDGEPLFERHETPLVLEARGWVSAMQNHYPPDAYDDDGLKLKRGRKHAKAGTAAAPATDPVQEPRAMTADERRAYCEQLLRDVAEQLPRPVEL